MWKHIRSTWRKWTIGELVGRDRAGNEFFLIRERHGIHEFKRHCVYVHPVPDPNHLDRMWHQVFMLSSSIWLHGVEC